MRRITIPVRRNLDRRIRESGFDFATVDGEPYWDESAYYAFSLAQIEDDIELATAELVALCNELVDRLVGDERRLTQLAIPRHAWDLIAASWKRRDPSLYGRFDLAYDGASPPKLLEYNADTPTALYEASVFQWLWLEDARAQKLIPANADQFNSMHEKLVARLAHIRSETGAERLHLTCMPESTEDRGLVSYLAECASQAKWPTTTLAIGDIGTTGSGPFVDLQERPIELLFKLYPWEWMFADSFGHVASIRHTHFVEPPWKAILSNKGILPLLWEMAPGHPNLLPAYFDGGEARARLGGSFAHKPLYSREGANVSLVAAGEVIDSDDGQYGREGFIVQALAPMPRFDGNTPVIGSWVIGDEPCGMGMREDTSVITKNTSRFIPHAFLP